MEFVIVTGLSGAGKTRAMHAMEDIGFFCVDNLPPALIPVFYDMCIQSEGVRNRAAVVTDTRGGELFKSFFTALESLKRDKKPYKILFLDSSDSVLVNRFQETRRKHPLADEMGGALEQAVKPVSYTHLDVYKRQVRGRGRETTPPKPPDRPCWANVPQL